jgi:hypothetical protein
MTYVSKRNRLIPIAEEFANMKAGKYAPKAKDRAKRDKWNDEWNFHFHQEMNRLAKEKGITNEN